MLDIRQFTDSLEQLRDLHILVLNVALWFTGHVCKVFGIGVLAYAAYTGTNPTWTFTHSHPFGSVDVLTMNIVAWGLLLIVIGFAYHVTFFWHSKRHNLVPEDPTGMASDPYFPHWAGRHERHTVIGEEPR